jgi:thiamine pyrophosphate-dependent acetolactate synthase large subunit-like protein
MLLLSAEAAVPTLGKGWGVLHEIREQKAVTAPLTAFSATARRAADIPELLAQAFSIFASERPRPVHISVPIDVQAAAVESDWQPVVRPSRPVPVPALVREAAHRLRAAIRPLMLIGGGAREAAAELVAVAEALGAIVISSTAGKGIVPDSHPLSLSASTVRPEVRALIAESDCVLAIGTELSETDSFVERLPLNGALIRVDIDARKINDLYPAALGIIADAAPAAAALALELAGHDAAPLRAASAAQVQMTRAAIARNLTASEQRHARFLAALRACTPPETVFAGDVCQLVYTGAFTLPVYRPRQWFYAAGYCALGNGLPNGIGAKLAQPAVPVIVLAGDGGFMFTMPELMTAAELGLALPIIVWENGGLRQIRDDMDARQIARVGVEGANPDFLMLARACGCAAERPGSIASLQHTVKAALSASQPTLIVVNEEAQWLD